MNGRQQKKSLSIKIPKKQDQITRLPVWKRKRPIQNVMDENGLTFKYNYLVTTKQTKLLHSIYYTDIIETLLQKFNMFFKENNMSKLDEIIYTLFYMDDVFNAIFCKNSIFVEGLLHIKENFLESLKSTKVGIIILKHYNEEKNETNNYASTVVCLAQELRYNLLFFLVLLLD